MDRFGIAEVSAPTTAVPRKESWRALKVGAKGFWFPKFFKILHHIESLDICIEH
jgi:hypothetical protein